MTYEIQIPIDHEGNTPEMAATKMKRGDYTPLHPLNNNIRIFPKAINSEKVTPHFACEALNFGIRAGAEIGMFHLGMQGVLMRSGFDMEVSFNIGDSIWRFDNYGHGFWVEVVSSCFGSLNDKSLLFYLAGRSDKLLVIWDESVARNGSQLLKKRGIRQYIAGLDFHIRPLFSGGDPFPVAF